MHCPRISTEVLTPTAQFPEKQHISDAGFDLTYTGKATLMVEQGEVLLVPCGCAVAIPEGYAGLICPRSGLAAKHGVTVVNAPGIIDSGYRGELIVILTKLTPGSKAIITGTRVAQLLITSVGAYIAPVKGVFNGGTDRGTKGFGSTGKN